MKLSTIAGVVLIIFGALALAYDGYEYRSHKGEPAPLHDKESQPLFSPIFGVVILAGGVILVIFGKPNGRKK